MKPRISIQERLKDLRVEHHLKLEELAEKTGISKSALGSYENNDFKEINHSSIVALAEFYNVSTDYLLGLTENRNHPNTTLTELHLSDSMVDILKSGHINNRLLCEIATHKEFMKLIADAEIYIDGIATMQIRNMNDWLDAIRTQLIQTHNSDETDMYIRLLKNAQIREEEYFFHIIHEDLDVILRDIREIHKNDIENAALESSISGKLIHSVQNTLRFKSNPLEEVWRIFCTELQIKYDKLSEEEHKTMMGIFKKSALLKQFPTRNRKKK